MSDLVKFVSKWVFTVDGSTRKVFPKMRTSAPKELRKDIPKYLKEKRIEIVDKKYLDDAREFVDEAKKFGFDPMEIRKGRFVATVVEKCFDEYVKGYPDLNGKTAFELKEIFGNGYDTTRVELKKTGIDVLTYKAIDYDKSDSKKYVEDYVSYVKQLSRGDYDFVDREYERNQYISSDFFEKNRKAQYLEMHCLFKGYRYSKSDADVREEECLRCHARYSPLLTDACPDCGERFFRRVQPLNGKYLSVEKDSVERIAELLSVILNGQYGRYPELYRQRGAVKEYVDEYYPREDMMEAIGPKLSQEKLDELDALLVMDPKEAILKAEQYKEAYGKMDPSIKDILKDAGYQERLKAVFKDVKKRYHDAVVTEFGQAVEEIEAAEDYNRAKALLDEFETYDPEIKKTITKNGMYDRLNGFYLTVVERLLNEKLTEIEEILSEPPSTYEESQSQLSRIEGIIESTDLPIVPVLESKGIDREIESLRELSQGLYKKEATEGIFRITDGLYADEGWDARFCTEAVALKDGVEALPKDLADYYMDNRREQYVSILDRFHLISAETILNEVYSDLSEEGRMLSEADIHIKQVSAGKDYAGIKKKLRSEYRKRLAEHNRRVRDETVRIYRERIDGISEGECSKNLYREAVRLRGSILNEGEEVVLLLTETGHIAKLDAAIDSLSAALDEEAVSALKARIDNLYSAASLEYKDLTEAIDGLEKLSPQQCQMFDREGRTVLEVKRELKEQTVAKDVLQTIGETVSEDYGDDTRKKTDGIDREIEALGPIAKTIVKSSPKYAEYRAYREEHTRWLRSKNCDAMSKIVKEMSTLPKFLEKEKELMRLYDTLPKEERESSEVQAVISDYKQVRKLHLKRQLDDYARCIEAAKNNPNEQTIKDLNRIDRALIDKKTKRYKELRAQYDAVVDRYEYDRLVANIESLGKLRGVFGRHLKKSPGEFIRVYEEVERAPAYLLDRLPEKLLKKLNGYREDYNNLRRRA